jgi:hypothetical protein
MGLKEAEESAISHSPKLQSAQTINKRPSKQLHKHRKLQKLGDFNARRERAESAIRDKESRYDLDVPEGS